MTAAAASAAWQVEMVVPAAAADALADALAAHAGAVSLFPAASGGTVRIAGYGAVEPDRAALRADLAVAAEAAGIAVPPVDIVWLPATDWAAVNRDSFPPQRIGRLWLRDSYHDEPPPAGTTTVVVDAATAFGTGHHATTRGCLRAIDRFARTPRRLPPGPVLDMGCGTGILAIAAARLLRRQVLATDVDPVAVAMARDNAARNRVGATVDIALSRGYVAGVVRRNAPYALILANILARPLARMAPACAGHLQPGGYAVLSGLLAAQERPVIAAHCAQGLVLVAREREDGWSTLLLRRPL